MDVIYPRCCGLDLHKQTVVACLLTSEAGQPPAKTLRTFGPMPTDLLALADWLHTAGCTHVARERTGVYWRPIDHLLEGLFTLLVVHAPHMKAVPGRKTDVKDAEWIAELLRHGLSRGRFIPAKPPRQLRALTRPRTTLVQDRARVITRVQAVWEATHITRASVVTDIRGGSARAMLEALIAGQRDTAALAKLARGRLRTKRDQLAEALRGYCTSPHGFLLTEVPQPDGFPG